MVDIDATVVTACSDKRQAMSAWKNTSGFHPVTAWGQASYRTVISLTAGVRIGVVPESNEPPRRGRLPTPAPRGESPAMRHDPHDHTNQYRLAYTETQRTLDDQRDELQGMRTRAVQFTAFVSAATAFLVGTGLHVTDKNAVFYALAATASAFSALSIVLLAMLLRPSNRKKWHYRMSARVLIDGWIEQTEVPPLSDARFLKELALAYDEMHSKNELLLGSLRTWYSWLIIVGSAQVVMWAVLVWLKS